MTRRFLLCLLLFALAPLGEAAVFYPKVLPPAYNGIYPFYLIGQLYFKSGKVDYIGSGTIIGVRSVLTAGHNVYDPRTGFSTNLDFYRNTYGAAHTPAANPATRKYVFANYQGVAAAFGADDVRSFARDSAGLLFGTILASRQHAVYSTNRDLLDGQHFQLAVGYGAEGAHQGDYPLFTSPSTPFFPTYGNFFEDTSIYIEGGMSGGPLVSLDKYGIYQVIGVVVSGSTQPVAGGVRMLDSALGSFIRAYLP